MWKNTKSIAGQLPRRSNIPARIVWGDADEFSDLSNGERLCERPRVHASGASKADCNFAPEDHPRLLPRKINALFSSRQRESSLIAVR